LDLSLSLPGVPQEQVHVLDLFNYPRIDAPAAVITWFPCHLLLTALGISYLVCVSELSLDFFLLKTVWHLSLMDHLLSFSERQWEKCIAVRGPDS
jgi:hypothetical protein